LVPFLLSLLAAAGFGAATLLVDTTIGTSRTFHHMSVVVAAGILLGVAFADLVPEAFDLAEPTTVALAIVGGFLALFLVEALTGGHTHHHEPHADHLHASDVTDQPQVALAHAHAHAHDHAYDHSHDTPCVTSHAVMPFLLGLGLHNLVDGLVIGTSHEVSDSAATGVAVGIVVHQLPVGLSFAAVLLACGLGRRRMRRDAVLIAAMIPLGALVVLASPALSGTSLGVLIGVAAGALVYIATGHLLPEAHSEERRPGIAAAFSFALLGTVLLVGAMQG
jgi:zinc transporter ZupT